MYLVFFSFLKNEKVAAYSVNKYTKEPVNIIIASQLETGSLWLNLEINNAIIPRAFNDPDTQDITSPAAGKYKKPFIFLFSVMSYPN